MQVGHQCYGMEGGMFSQGLTKPFFVEPKVKIDAKYYQNNVLKHLIGESYVKSLVYADKPQTLDHLEDNIRRVIAGIRPQMLEKVIENWTSRLDYIRASRGSHTPEIIFKISIPLKKHPLDSLAACSPNLSPIENAWPMLAQRLALDTPPAAPTDQFWQYVDMHDCTSRLHPKPLLFYAEACGYSQQ
ncbi:hypothetical protein TNCV_1504571 [Trichonephila clavipes]|uniref:Uncharacterized protein n=1 Tax=Trichonephila clavipes TaxID=2585209 RepID=A0A8X6UZK7_TRICX|nr:hypothetical protein TNCV_1504571 [Trichonephila clavipes]